MRTFKLALPFTEGQLRSHHCRPCRAYGFKYLSQRFIKNLKDTKTLRSGCLGPLVTHGSSQVGWVLGDCSQWYEQVVIIVLLLPLCIYQHNLLKKNRFPTLHIWENNLSKYSDVSFHLFMSVSQRIKSGWKNSAIFWGFSIWKMLTFNFTEIEFSLETLNISISS